MRYDPLRRHRRSIRLKGYNYARPGAYFVTICVQGRLCLLGEIVGGDMARNDAGRMVEEWWRKLPDKFPIVEIDQYIVMPNHMHGIIVITEWGDKEGVHEAGQTTVEVGRTRGFAPTDADPTVGADPGVRPDRPRIIQWFKTMTTNAYIRGVHEGQWAPFCKRLWQRSYYEHIIRDDADLERIRAYIVDNTAHWAADPENIVNWAQSSAREAR